MKRGRPFSATVGPQEGRPSARKSAKPTRRRRSAVRSAAVLPPEVKFYDTALAATTIAAATDATGGEYDPSATSMISTPAVGDTEQNRDGKRIIIKSVQVKGNVTANPQEGIADPVLAQQVMVAIVLDTQSNGAQCNSEDIFKNLAANAQTNCTPMRNLLFGPRFRVLRTEVFDLHAETLQASVVNSFTVNGVRKNFDWFIPFPKGLVVNFNAGTTASIVNVIDNSIHVIAYSVVANEPVPTLSYNARIRFVG